MHSLETERRARIRPWAPGRADEPFLCGIGREAGLAGDHLDVVRREVRESETQPRCRKFRWFWAAASSMRRSSRVERQATKVVRADIRTFRAGFATGDCVRE